MAGKDFYQTLGVERTATPAEIKRAYRKLARKHHPDVNPGDKKAEEQFKEVNAAFEILSEPEKRKLYDEFGEDAAKIGFDPAKAKAYREWKAQADRAGRRRAAGAEGAEGPDVEGFGGFEGVNIEDLFGDLLSRGGGGGRARRRTPGFEDGPVYEQGPEPGPDFHAEMTVDLLDALRGSEREIEMSKPVQCRTCHGGGTSPGASAKPCTRCGGRGRLDVSQGPLRFESVCPVCRGSGRQPGPPCPDCGGTGVRFERARLKVKIPAGLKDGQAIRLKGQGMPGTRGGEAGDLLIMVHVAPHAWLRREGDDLYLDLPLTVEEAMFGTRVEIPTLEGTVKLKIPAGSQTGQKLRLKGKGVLKKGGAGDLYVSLAVKVPDGAAEDAQAREAAAALSKLYRTDVRAGLRL